MSSELLLSKKFDTALFESSINFYFLIIEIGIIFGGFIYIYLRFKNINYFLSSSFRFLIINAFSVLFTLLKKNNNNFVVYGLIYLSNILQFIIVINFYDTCIKGQNIFKTDVKFLIKFKILLSIIYCLIRFPFSKYFENIENTDILIYLLYIVFIVYLYTNLNKTIDELIKYLCAQIPENNQKISTKDIKFQIQIKNMSIDDLIDIYISLNKFNFIIFCLLLFCFVLKILANLFTHNTSLFEILFKFYIFIHKIFILALFLQLITILYKLNQEREPPKKSYDEEDFDEDYESNDKNYDEKNNQNDNIYYKPETNENYSLKQK